jgi:hypothetical protein
MFYLKDKSMEKQDPINKFFNEDWKQVAKPFGKREEFILLIKGDEIAVFNKKFGCLELEPTKISLINKETPVSSGVPVRSDDISC